MELIRGLHNLAPRHRGCVATIGNFDGVHRGHQAIFGQLRDIAREADLPSTVMTFEPQPREFFSGDSAPARLTRAREKLLLLAQEVDRVVLVHFDEQFSRLSAQSFIDDVLVGALGVAHLVVGDDFHFGHRATGHYQDLVDAGARHGFQLSRCVTFDIRGRRVSSTWVRDALADGDLELAAELLGRHYAIRGRVMYGQRLGRTIGFRTANIALRRRGSPLSGVYAVHVHGVEDGAVPGMANVGTRPTVNGTIRLLEVHLFDLEADLYGRELCVDFLHKLRDEQRFESVEALKAQLGRDEARARELLGGGGN